MRKMPRNWRDKMTDKKRQTWEVVNPGGDYIVVRSYREAKDIEKDQNEFILGFDAYYQIRKGKPMTDKKLKALPELDCF